MTSIKFDPFDSRRFATLTEENIKIFDVRNMRRPIVVLSEPENSALLSHDDMKQFGGFEWSQLRSNLIVSFMKKTVIQIPLNTFRMLSIFGISLMN